MQATNKRKKGAFVSFNLNTKFKNKQNETKNVMIWIKFTLRCTKLLLILKVDFNRKFKNFKTVFNIVNRSVFRFCFDFLILISDIYYELYCSCCRFIRIFPHFFHLLFYMSSFAKIWFTYLKKYDSVIAMHKRK